jgi:hypothetical protein
MACTQTYHPKDATRDHTEILAMRVGQSDVSQQRKPLQSIMTRWTAR